MLKLFSRLFILVITIFVAIAYATSRTDIKTDKVVIGNKTSADKFLEFNTNLGSANPKIKANVGTSRLQYSNDGVNFLDIGSGSSSGSGSSGYPLSALTGSNPGFEDGATGWSMDADITYTVNTTLTHVLTGEKSLRVTNFANTIHENSVKSSLVDLTKYSGTCMGYVRHKGTLTSSNVIYLTIKDSAGSEYIAAGLRAYLKNSTGFTFAKVYFPCPTSGNHRLVVTGGATTTDLYFDNAHLGESDDQQSVAAQAIGSSISATSGSPINMSTIEDDTHSAITTGASWKFTAPESGYYLVGAASAKAAAGGNVTIYKNGSASKGIFSWATSAGVSSGASILYLTKGTDYVDIRSDFTGTITFMRVYIYRIGR